MYGVLFTSIAVRCNVKVIYWELSGRVLMQGDDTYSLEFNYMYLPANDKNIDTLLQKA